MTAAATRRVPLRPRMTLGEALDTAVAAAGDDTTLAADGDRVTLSELRRRALHLADVLVSAGVGPGDHVALLLPNGVAYAEAFFAVVAHGAVAVPLDPRLTAREYAAVGGRVGLRAVLAEAGELDGDLRARLAAAGTAPAVVVRDAAGWEPRGPLPGGAPGTHAPVSPADPAAVFFTSGTTGEPKPVTHTHRSLVASLVAFQRLHAAFFTGSALEQLRRVVTVARRYRTRVIRAGGRQVWMTATPFRAIAGHELLTGSLLLGHSLVTTRAFHPRRALDLLERERVNVFAATPAMVEVMLRTGDVPARDLGSLLVVGLGGGPAPPRLIEAARAAFGCAVINGYGSTEMGGGVLVTRLDDPDDVQAETVGRPFPGVEVRVVGGDGEELRPGEVGELHCRPPGQDDGWYPTGDLASIDHGGNVRILGRKDDLIIRGGQNVHPVEVETVIEELDGVGRCAVVGVPVRDGYEQVWAFIVPADGRPPPVRGDVARHCREQLSPAKVPDHVRVRAGLPLTEQGEVRRHVLVAEALEETEGAAG